MKDETPCRYCRNHSPTCHSECKLYLDWRERHLEKKEKGAKGKEPAENDGRKGKGCIKSHDL